MKRFRKSAIALVLALLMALQGTEPIFVQAKEAIEDVQKNADFSRPEALTEEEAGITDSTSGEQDKSQQSDADVQNETTPSENTETQEEQTTPAEETEENPQEKEVELKEPQDYYPIPEEPEGELIDYDAVSKTYKTGDKQYTTVYGGYVGTYKNEDGDTETFPCLPTVLQRAVDMFWDLGMSAESPVALEVLTRRSGRTAESLSQPMETM